MWHSCVTWCRKASPVLLGEPTHPPKLHSANTSSWRADGYRHRCSSLYYKTVYHQNDFEAGIWRQKYLHNVALKAHDAMGLLIWRKWFPVSHFKNKKSTGFGKSLSRKKTASLKGQKKKKPACYSKPDGLTGHVQTCPSAKLEMCNLGGNYILGQTDHSVICWLHKLSLTFSVSVAAVG